MWGHERELRTGSGQRDINSESMAAQARKTRLKQRRDLQRELEVYEGRLATGPRQGHNACRRGRRVVRTKYFNPSRPLLHLHLHTLQPILPSSPRSIFRITISRFLTSCLLRSSSLSHTMASQTTPSKKVRDAIATTLSTYKALLTKPLN